MTRVGVLGAGQLGRMLALAGYPLGLSFRFLDHSPDAPARDVGELMVAEFQDTQALDAFADSLDVLTYEFENVPVATVQHLAKRLPVFPPAAALEASQDRWVEKTSLRELGIPTAPFAAVANLRELDEAAAQVGHPSILKTRRMGYDGKGQVRISRADEHADAYMQIAEQPAVLEGVVPFERELSLLAVRGQTGQSVFYPLIENHHASGILRKSIAPAPGLAPRLQELAEEYGRTLLEKMGYVGVLAIEFFQLGDQLMVNEMAPRVHNSGHWSIEGAQTSQFENHLRAICGFPLGSTLLRGYSVMLNCIGHMPAADRCLTLPGVHYHSYAKAPREGRKVGHLTLCRDTETELRKDTNQLECMLAEGE